MEAVAAALENFDLARTLKNKDASAEEENRDNVSTGGDDLFKDSSPKETSLLREDSQEECIRHRPRSISDIVQETRNSEAGCSSAVECDSPVGMEGSTSLQGSFSIRNPSTSSHPESIDSTGINITVNKDTASTATQTGSLGEVEGSGREGSDLILARRSSQLARRRRNIQRTSARRRRRTGDSASAAGPFTGVLLHAMDTAPPQAHVAASYNDTTPGALHCYQDEFGE